MQWDNRRWAAQMPRRVSPLLLNIYYSNYPSYLLIINQFSNGNAVIARSYQNPSAHQVTRQGGC